MTNKFSRLIVLMAFDLVVLFFTPLRSQASVGDTFTNTPLKYTVLSESDSTKTGTVSVEAESKEISGDFTIPETVEKDGYTYSVTMIPKAAFIGCKKLTSITIPDGVTSIGGWAFNRCLRLRNLNIQSQITTIDSVVFCCCWDLEEITIPNSVTEIEFAAFAFCYNLKEVEIPESVIRLGDAAFAGCRSLTAVNYKGNRPLMGKDVFMDTPLEHD
ncbi:MAG: leucine-rich repeat domain-containing protein [Verrucomicrobia bacterium]|nr:leucine-rich repeat domain-containing protein [Verrucomicrobiota bacterium]